jgi:predicted nucleotidyltransferase
MDLSSPLATITPTLDAGVLQVLSATTGSCTAAEVHRRMGRHSDEGVRKVLSRLVGQGVVLVDASSRYPLYRLNREHVAAPLIEGLTRLRQRIIENLIEELGTWEIQPSHAGLFGSFARATAGVDSDIDMLMVRPTTTTLDEARWTTQLEGLERHVHMWTGNDAQVLDITLDDLRRLEAAQDPLFDSLRSETIPLHGPRLLDLLRGGT